MALYTARGIVAISNSLPAGVTLQAIDGESLTSATTMSKNYFARIGATIATNRSYNGTSWDDQNFFPLTLYFGINTGDLTDFLTLGFPTVGPGITGDTLNSTMTSNLLWGINGGFGITAGRWQVTSSGTTLNANTSIDSGVGNISVGDVVYASDGTNSLPQGTTIAGLGTGTGQTGTYILSSAASPGNLSSCVLYDTGGTVDPTLGSTFSVAIHNDEGIPRAFAGGAPDSLFVGRWWNTVQTHNALQFGAIGSDAMTTLLAANAFTTPGGNPLSIGSLGCDFYWFAVAPRSGDQSQAAGMLNVGSVTQDQMARGSNYGNMIDTFRSWGNGSNPNVGGNTGNVFTTPGTGGAVSRIPFWGTVENSNGLAGVGSNNITPAEYNWAIWSSIIHGARGLTIFVYTEGHGAGFTNPPPATGGTFSQAIVTNTLISSLASVLNSPFALGFCTVSPHGYLFPIPESNWFNGGIEVMVKWSGGKFYIFSCTRYGETGDPINQAATFTIPAGAGNTATILDGRGGTKTISGGNFTDTFVHSYDVFIYRIDP